MTAVKKVQAWYLELFREERVRIVKEKNVVQQN